MVFSRQVLIITIIIWYIQVLYGIVKELLTNMINLKFWKLPEKLILSLLEGSLALFLLCILEPAFNRYFHCWNLVWQEVKREKVLQIFTVYTTSEFEKPNNSLPRTRDQASCNIRVVCHIIIIQKTKCISCFVLFEHQVIWTPILSLVSTTDKLVLRQRRSFPHS